MKTNYLLFFTAILVCTFFNSSLQAQDSTKIKDNKTEHNQFFIDKDGDGYNDNAPDHDGDGIPNGLDSDWQKLKKSKGKKKLRYIDLDGDGVDDNMNYENQKKSEKEKKLNDSGPLMNGKGKKNERRQKRSGKK